jgi:translation initiation factor 2 gamma subunit (eIF-2gamma)
MDDIDKAQYQENIVRSVELGYRKRIIYKCETCNDQIDPKAKIKRWCNYCIEERNDDD